MKILVAVTLNLIEAYRCFGGN